MKVELFDFWPDGHVGHIDSDGIDVGKKFLTNLGLELREFRHSNLNVYSHFYKNTYARRMKRAVERIFERKLSSSINKRKMLHGYQTQFPKLDSRDLNIWYTPENLRPPLDQDFDIFLSHDLDKYDGRNIYLPIWATRLGTSIDSAIQEQKKFLKNREQPERARNGICAVISNPEPIRMSFISELRKFCPVDIYGALGESIKDKDEVLLRYKFNICFENDDFPGYVTEKPFEAWKSGCVPIWWGNDKGNYINHKSIIDVSTLGFTRAIEVIVGMLKSDEKYQEYFGERLLNHEFDFADFKKEILNRANERNN
jgi:hypothetical protein